MKRIKWFKESPDTGLPECLCSLCSKMIGKDEVPIRLFDEENDLEARFHHACYHFGKTPMECPAILSNYLEAWGVPMPPHQLPKRGETGKAIYEAIMAYLGYMSIEAEDRDEPPNGKQIELLRQYLSHSICAPCWRWSGSEAELLDLRYRVNHLETPEEVNEWIMDCLNLGVDPL